MPWWMDAIEIGLTAFRGPNVEPDPTLIPAAAARTHDRGGRIPRAVTGARAVQTSVFPLFQGFTEFQAPVSPDTIWRNHDLDAETLGRMPAPALLNLLKDLSPEISKGLWDFLRMGNPGYTFETTPASAKTVVETFLTEIAQYHTSLNVVINRILMGGYLRGALFAELILDGEVPVDIATPDPQTARFRKVQDPVRGKVWQLGQIQYGEFVPLVGETVRYVPIDPAPDSPYGRPPVAPALFSSIFLLGMLHDLKRVIQQQGYPRLDIEIKLDELIKMMKEDDRSDPAKLELFVEAAIKSVTEIYSRLQPEDAYVHTSAIKINRPVGTIDVNSISAIGPLISALERMIVRALKTMPLLLGITESASDSAANRQWEIHVAGIKSIQHLAESLLEHLLETALRAQGIVAKVTFRFAELRASEELRDAQTLQVTILNAFNMWRLGYITQDQAALMCARQLAVADEPLYMDNSLTPPDALGAAPETTPEADSGDETVDANEPDETDPSNDDDDTDDGAGDGKSMPRLARQKRYRQLVRLAAELAAELREQKASIR